MDYDSVFNYIELNATDVKRALGEIEIGCPFDQTAVADCVLQALEDYACDHNLRPDWAYQQDAEGLFYKYVSKHEKEIWA